MEYDALANVVTNNSELIAVAMKIAMDLRIDVFGSATTTLYSKIPAHDLDLRVHSVNEGEKYIRILSKYFKCTAQSTWAYLEPKNQCANRFTVALKHDPSVEIGIDSVPSLSWRKMTPDFEGCSVMQNKNGVYMREGVDRPLNLVLDDVRNHILRVIPQRPSLRICNVYSGLRIVMRARAKIEQGWTVVGDYASTYVLLRLENPAKRVALDPSIAPEPNLHGCDCASEYEYVVRFPCCGRTACIACAKRHIEERLKDVFESPVDPYFKCDLCCPEMVTMHA